MWAVMPIKLWRYYTDWLLDEKYQLDELTRSVLTGPSVFDSAMYRGNIHGVEIFTTSALSAPASSGSSQKWTFYLGVPQAITFAQRNPLVSFITPEDNQTGPDYLLRQIHTHGRLAVHENLIYKAEIPTA